MDANQTQLWPQLGSFVTILLSELPCLGCLSLLCPLILNQFRNFFSNEKGLKLHDHMAKTYPYAFNMGAALAKELGRRE